MSKWKEYKKYLPDYLEKYYGITNLNNFFHCLNPKHIDNHPSMMFTSKYNICKCFSCGVSYDIFDIIGLDYNVSSFKDKIAIANKIFPNILESPNQFKTLEVPNKPIDFKYYFQKCMKNIGKTNYLNKRGIASYLIYKYKIGYDINKKMIIFPINKNCYFGRSTNNNIKIKSKGISYLWNEKLLHNNENKLIYITESIIDSLSLETIDPTIKTVALNGLPNYKRLLNIIKKYNYKGYLVLAFDNDKVGTMYQNIVKEELTKLNVSSFSITLISNIDNSVCKDINEALINKRDVLEKNYKYCNNSLKKIIEKEEKKESEMIL